MSETEPTYAEAPAISAANTNPPDLNPAPALAPIKPDFAQARAALVFVIFLQLALDRQLRVGVGLLSEWLIPGTELALLIVLSGLTTMRLRRLSSGSDAVEIYLQKHGGAPRVLAFVLIGLITVTNVTSLLRLVYALLHATRANGFTLLDNAANLWVTNVVCFALWYWELDRGGPARRGLPGEKRPDFLFANMQAPDFCKKHWRPGFIDYLYLAFTNATAFSPTDALPLTRGAKVVMMVQSSVSLLTIALVAARAVNILS
jgi:hypothetical protein